MVRQGTLKPWPHSNLQANIAAASSSTTLNLKQWIHLESGQTSGVHLCGVMLSTIRTGGVGVPGRGMDEIQGHRAVAKCSVSMHKDFVSISSTTKVVGLCEWINPSKHF